MEVSYRWLKSYVPVDWDPQELADRLTFAGLSVEQVTYLDKGLKNIIVAEVLSVEEHPTNKKNRVCQVSTGSETLTIVCGAPNVRAGIKVPLAQVGATLPGNITIGAADKGGITSYGMLCGADELDLPDGLAGPESDKGIFILPEECNVGDDIVDALWLDDAILEFELTPNRADCLSVINIAREVAAISGKPLHLPSFSLPVGEGNVQDIAAVEVFDKETCPRFTARVIKGLKVGPSPYWLRHRLACSGIRSINNVVDISNYVLLEMNQPSHTFDYDNLADHKIVVRRAEEGEELVTLDEMKRTLHDSMLLICDGERPVSIAGVMGGMDTEIEETTRNILIECAYFYPKSIRRTSRTLGLTSESSLRFEKGIDLENVPRASDRLVQLICELAGGTYIEGIIDSFDGTLETHQVHLRYQRTRDTLGIDIEDQTIESIMQSLKFHYETTADGVTVTVPSYRQDIRREADLIEEVARLHGYDKIPSTLPDGKMTEGRKTFSQKAEDKIKQILVAAGFREIVTYGFMNKSHYDLIRLSADDERRLSVAIKNPFSDEQGVMRRMLLPSILTVAATNMKRKSFDLALFELAHVFEPRDGERLPAEPAHLSALVSGKLGQGWNDRGQEMDFFYLKGVLELLFRQLHITDWTLENAHKEPFLHPGRSADILVNGEYLGFLGELHPLVADAYDLPQRAVVWELNVPLLVAKALHQVEYRPISKYPAIEIDLAFLAPIEVSAANIEAAIRAAGGDYLEKVELFDIYLGGQVGLGKKSLAYHLEFRTLERTLSADEVQENLEAIKKQLQDTYDIVLRS